MRNYWSYSELVDLGPSFFPFVIDFDNKRDHLWEAMDWCLNNFGKIGTIPYPKSKWALDPNAQWACINYKFCFNDLVVATHFKMRWG